MRKRASLKKRVALIRARRKAHLYYVEIKKVRNKIRKYLKSGRGLRDSTTNKLTVSNSGGVYIIELDFNKSISTLETDKAGALASLRVVQSLFTEFSLDTIIEHLDSGNDLFYELEVESKNLANFKKVFRGL